MRTLVLIFCMLWPGLVCAKSSLTESGQAGMAAIAEIITILDENPQTNWEEVNIPALARHLADMEHVYSNTEITQHEVGGFLVFSLSGPSHTRDAIRRVAHAQHGVHPMDWQLDVIETPGGATIRVMAPPDQFARLRAIGFLGLLADLPRQKQLHWQIATGQNPS